jgi:hypothetical protein
MEINIKRPEPMKVLNNKNNFIGFSPILNTELITKNGVKIRQAKRYKGINYQFYFIKSKELNVLISIYQLEGFKIYTPLPRLDGDFQIQLQKFNNQIHKQVFDYFESKHPDFIFNMLKRIITNDKSMSHLGI